MSAVSRPGFFRIGVTIMCFYESGSRPYRRDLLTVWVTNGRNTSMNTRNMKARTGSKEQDLIGDDITILRTSSVNTIRRMWTTTLHCWWLAGRLCWNGRAQFCRRRRRRIRPPCDASASHPWHTSYVEAKATSSSRFSWKNAHKSWAV